MKSDFEANVGVGRSILDSDVCPYGKRIVVGIHTATETYFVYQLFPLIVQLKSKNFKR